jgi:hypothetical protein
LTQRPTANTNGRFKALKRSLFAVMKHGQNIKSTLSGFSISILNRVTGWFFSKKIVRWHLKMAQNVAQPKNTLSNQIQNFTVNLFCPQFWLLCQIFRNSPKLQEKAKYYSILVTLVLSLSFDGPIFAVDNGGKKMKMDFCSFSFSFCTESKTNLSITSTATTKKRNLLRKALN